MATIVNADTIFFKDGSRLVVDEVWEEDGQVKFQMSGMTVGYPKEKVDRFEKSFPPPDPVKKKYKVKTVKAPKVPETPRPRTDAKAMAETVGFAIFILFLAFIAFYVLMRLAKKKDHGKYFEFITCDSTSEAEPNKWYRLRKWRSPNYLKMETFWTDDWKAFSAEETVVGVTRDTRQDDFLLMGDRTDFNIFLEREKDNPVDPNAIKVMGFTTVEEKSMVRQLGYLSKETAEALKNEKEIDARPYSVFLPYKDRSYDLKVRVLVRSESYKKKMEKT
ncbi:HIRAN domain-containing protein [Thermodesulfobacteriota bacterium]